MVFSSLLFLFRFLPVFFIIYFVTPKRFRNGVIFLASLFFYGWGEPVYMSLLLFSTLVDYVHGRMIGKMISQGRKSTAKYVVASSVVINLGLLGFFKYSDFLIGSWNQISGMSVPLLSLALPIGISFYTFQTMSYTIDVYRGEAEIQRNIVSFGAYVSMFPQLIAGPIVRYQTIARELTERVENWHEFGQGVGRFTVGLGKKVLLANTIGAVWSEISEVPQTDQSVVMLWLGVFAYGMQIYFDFSGYSDMAIGLGLMLGFHFPENFDYPYESKSITEFWRRWHISLGTWFKEYVYIPLGGNRKGLGRQVVNILIVWLLTGIWHGAGWNFLLWGLYFGLWLLAEKVFLKCWMEEHASTWLQHVYTILIVFGGWILFSHDHMTQGIAYMIGMSGLGRLEFMNGRTLYLIATNGVLIFGAILGSTSMPVKMWGCLKKRMKPELMDVAEGVGIVMILLMSTAYLVNASYNPFLYFRF